MTNDMIRDVLATAPGSGDWYSCDLASVALGLPAVCGGSDAPMMRVSIPCEPGGRRRWLRAAGARRALAARLAW